MLKLTAARGRNQNPSTSIARDEQAIFQWTDPVPAGASVFSIRRPRASRGADVFFNQKTQGQQGKLSHT